MGKTAGDRIGRYIVDRRLGVGGMAEAWLAHQEGPAGFSKPVVVKALLAQHAEDPKMVELFLHEARVGARLNHTNIVQIFDLGEANGEHYIAMEYVEGLTLQQLVRRCWALGTGIPVDIAVRVIAAVAAGLQYAHTVKGHDGSDNSVVHRDISPDNIMIARDGTVKILDFGVAKLRGTESTRSGELKGKIPFMSPEQLEGDDLDGRTDLWALGVTLYWCVCGRRPFTAANDVHVIREILESTPTRARELNKIISPELDDIIASLLEKDRDKRVPTAAKLASRLQRAVPPSQGNPLARFLEKMMVFNDDPPEARARTNAAGGSGIVGLPAAPAERDSTEIVMRDGSAHAELVDTAAPPAPARDPDVTVDEDAETGNGHAQTVFLIRRRRRAALVAAMSAAAVVVGVVAWVVTREAPPAEPTPLAVVSPPPPTPVHVEAPPAPVVAPADPTPVDGGVESPEAVPRAPRRSAEQRSVVVSAPGHIKWTTANGKPLGQGSRTLLVPESDKTIIAVDPKRDGRITVNVASKIDWDTLPRAMLTVRVLPYATGVKLGGELLGPTPLKPQSIVVGAGATYRVTVLKEGQKEVRTVKARPGEDALLAVDLRR